MSYTENLIEILFSAKTFVVDSQVFEHYSYKYVIKISGSTYCTINISKNACYYTNHPGYYTIEEIKRINKFFFREKTITKSVGGR